MSKSAPSFRTITYLTVPDNAKLWLGQFTDKTSYLIAGPCMAALSYYWAECLGDSQVQQALRRAWSKPVGWVEPPGRANARPIDSAPQTSSHASSLQSRGHRFAPPYMSRKRAVLMPAQPRCCADRTDLPQSIGAERVSETQHGLATFAGADFFSQQCGSFPWMPGLTHVHASHFSFFISLTAILGHPAASRNFCSRCRANVRVYDLTELRESRTASWCRGMHSVAGRMVNGRKPTLSLAQCVML